MELMVLWLKGAGESNEEKVVERNGYSVFLKVEVEEK